MAPLFCKELNCCFFITNVEDSIGSLGTMEEAKSVIQAIFKMLIGNRLAIVLDLQDFEREDGIDLEQLIQQALDEQKSITN